MTKMYGHYEKQFRTQPWLPRHGNHKQTSLLYSGESHEANCTDGFMFFNNKTQTFVGKGVASLNVKNELGVLKLPDYPSLSTDHLECQDARCDTPLVKNGTMFTYERPRDPVNETKLKHGQKSVIKCNAGYQLFNHSNEQLTSEEFDILCNFTKIAPDTHPVCQLSQLNSAKKGCRYLNIRGAVLLVNGNKTRQKKTHGTKGEVRCRANFTFAADVINNGSVQCQNGVWVPNVTCRHIEHASKESATNARNSSTISPTEQITATDIDKKTTKPIDYDDYDEPKVLTTQGPPVEASTVTYITSPSADEFNSTDDSQDSGRCTLTKSTDITYWNASHNKELSTPQTVINRSRVRVRLTCPQKIGEYPDYYNGDEADNRNEKEAEIECVDGEFTMHNLTCETGEENGQLSSNSSIDPCKSIANGNITDRGRSVVCDKNHSLKFSNGMDSALYENGSCTCNRTSDTFRCLGSTVECKPNGCPLPQSLEQGLTLYDSKGNRFSTSANPDAIPHGRALIFNCTSSGNQYNEPNGRTFACHKGSWIGKPLPGEEWSFDNNGSFPKCRPAVCKHACQNGGWCKATDTCKCPERFKGAYCEISAGCAKPEGNLVNLEKKFYDDGETLSITDLNCDRGYLPSSGDTTCKNGNWSDTISCVPAIVYKIRVVTADVRGAGTDGNVTIKLKGTAGNTGLIGLPGRFEQKNIDDIAKLLPDVGTIITITIGVTRINMFDGWKPSHVAVHDTWRNHFYLFQHDGTELDNRSITLGMNGCVTTYTVKGGFLTGHLTQYFTYKYGITTVFECMMFCSQYNCVQAEYTAPNKSCGIATRFTRPVTERRDDAIHVLTPYCVRM